MAKELIKFKLKNSKFSLLVPFYPVSSGAPKPLGENPSE